jgi:uncharacterized protein YuzE
MKVQYDPGADALYVYLLEGATVDRTLEMDDLRMIDVDTADRVIGIEIICPSEGFTFDDIIRRHHLEAVRPALEEIEHREFVPNPAWRKSSPAT